ncbi:cora-domain-containing protein [Rhizodiscina lignyota]|uniref:Cora-domain-containing protein n=1 Tax=Rhizodiscina lignyota TaxID=1504668 RepID=A0A9P4M905_9PEZI|nr:cora-domain-containing protein [Rhizodiscina lignyota]
MTDSPTSDARPTSRGDTLEASTSTFAAGSDAGEHGKTKKKKHRSGKKRRNRRQSFAAHSEDVAEEVTRPMERPSLMDTGVGRTRSEQERERESFYRLGRARSSESLDSEALLDHRDQGPLQTRRQSITAMLSQRTGQSSPRRFAPRHTLAHVPESTNRSRLSRTYQPSDDDDGFYNDYSPLIKARRGTPTASTPRDYGGLSGPSNEGRPSSRHGGKKSRDSSRSSGRKHHSTIFERQASAESVHSYDVNNPPSRPGSPALGPDMGYDDVMLTNHELSRSPDDRRLNGNQDTLIDIDGPRDATNLPRSTPPSPGMLRHRSSINPAEGDVCFPHEAFSEIGDDDYSRFSEADTVRRRRRRQKKWPELSYLEEWSLLEKEERTLGGIRSRRVNEPIFVEGRLRPRQTWHREEEDAPYRFTYFNEEFESTIHAQTISELVQEGQTFRHLFIPDPPIIDDSSSDEEDEQQSLMQVPTQSSVPPSVRGKVTPPDDGSQMQSPSRTGTPTPQFIRQKEPRYGSRPIFWLDVMSPTDAEMRVLTKAFRIHPLTAEDIMMQEAREKVELFKNYYFVNYRTFEQDTNSENYLEPVNMYVVVFREGVLSFHFSQTPHPANVRRRVRQLTDYLVMSSDWISYAIIDDITDIYAPLIQRIEDEVDAIDAEILGLRDAMDKEEEKKQQNIEYEPIDQDDDGKREKTQDDTTGYQGGDMLRRTGECRKKVMSLYRLLGTKADVIKGFAKRCTEQWDIAPRNDIGLYLGDIQDHIVTMTGNLSHYENLLSRAHSNYLAQINIRMNERAERTNDILGKLTVIGTIVLPMNIITGMWGMNCLVPGQDGDNLNWFWSITAGLVCFGLCSYLIAKRVYGIV